MRPLIAGNWKMQGLRADLTEIAAIAAAAVELQPDVDILVCRSATLITEASL
jgi:triosephosphate isomerase